MVIEGLEIDEKLENYIEYPTKVLNDEIVSNRYIKLACKRFLYDISSDSDYFLDTEVCDKIVRIIESLTLFKEGFVGKQMQLMLWQKFLLFNLFGIKYKNNTEKRKYSQAMLFIGRKNGKSLLSASIAIYELMTAPANSEFIIVAPTRAQARISFGFCVEFLKRLDKKGKHFKLQRETIIFKKTNSKIFVLSSENSTLDGYGASAIIDECESYKDSRVVDTIRNGQGAMQNPLTLLIGTGGYDKDYFYNQYLLSIQVLEGSLKQENLFSLLYTLDEEDDYQDERNWVKSNPSLGITVNKDFIREQVEESKINPSMEISTKIKNFNIWSDVASTWIPSYYLEQCYKDINLEDWIDKEITIYVGVDLAATSDLTAVSLMWKYEDTYYFKTFYYLPTETVKTSALRERYKLWVKNGNLTAHEGNCTDYDAIEQEILKLSNQYSIQEIAYDDWNATQWAIRCTEDGLPLNPFAQNMGNYNRPTKEITRLIMSNKVVIDNNDITRFCFSNVVLKYDYNDNCRPTKTSNDNKIDGCIAMIMALGSYLNAEHFNNELFVI